MPTRARRWHPSPHAAGEVQADVCIVGGGYTGLSAALHLAQKGLRVVVLEAHRVGFGASGRNGGQVGSGQRQDQVWLEKAAGRDAAHRLWALAEDAKALVRDLIAGTPCPCHLPSRHRPCLLDRCRGARNPCLCRKAAPRLRL
jgi:gamma-glutamylputrescine oxidase